MKVFHCDHCQSLVFFENVACGVCQRTLAFLPDFEGVGSLDPAEEGLFKSPLPEAADRRYRLCQNYTTHNTCNWAIPADDPNPLCPSCRLTHVIPNLATEAAVERWYKVEAAKRRLIYGLTRLGCPIDPKSEENPNGLAFEFLADNPDGTPVLTGHADGLITLNIAEADDVERERRRTMLHEPYRTLLGHFRHEVGHYYWDLLIANRPRLEEFRKLFGDEQVDYAAALQKHYEQGAVKDWSERCVSAYASVHPWEDWAETWAHYMHMVDTLETAVACGLSLRPRRSDEPTLLPPPARGRTFFKSFDLLIESWFPLTYVLNNLNRGMGQPDGYPFVLPTPAIEKLRFIHDTIQEVNTKPQQKRVATSEAAPKEAAVSA